MKLTCRVLKYHHVPSQRKGSGNEVINEVPAQACERGQVGVREIRLGALLVLIHDSLTHMLRFHCFPVIRLKVLISLPFNK